LNTTERIPGTEGDARFPKKVRLRKADEFKAVYAGGKKKSSRSFDVFILPNERKLTRFGLTTSRKLGKAHDRNRIRRRVREILRRERKGFPAGFDVVVNPRRSVLERDFETLRTELVSVLGSLS
jgi:ribonuclease P protein component